MAFDSVYLFCLANKMDVFGREGDVEVNPSNCVSLFWDE